MKRRLLLPVCIAATALLLTSCSGTGTAEPSATDGEVTLVHPTVAGLEISFDAQPETLVMDCYAYSSLHEYGLEPDALFGFDCENPFVMGDIDISGIEIIGQDGEINVEKLAELGPDVIIGQGDADGWSWFDEEVNSQLMRVAPFVPLPTGDDIEDRISTTRELAAFFGGAVDADEVVAADKDLAAAKQKFSDAVTGSDLNFLLASPAKEVLYTAVGFAQTNLIEELGATVIGPDAPETGNPWGQVAWEEASSYPADIILVEGFSDDYSFTAELWEDLPAVAADQVGSWGSKGAITSRAYADWLTELTEMVESSQKVS